MSRIRTFWATVATVIVLGMLVESVNAATVSFSLNPFPRRAGVFNVYVSASLGDNDGLAA